MKHDQSDQFPLDRSPDLVYATTDLGVVTMINRAGAELLGFSRAEEVVGMNIADFYEAEVDTKVKALTSLLEPVMIVVVGGMVGFIVISMYLPMFKMLTLIGNQ